MRTATVPGSMSGSTIQAEGPPATIAVCAVGRSSTISLPLDFIAGLPATAWPPAGSAANMRSMWGPTSSGVRGPALATVSCARPSTARRQASMSATSTFS
jgi:hypothetical protein